jgi:Zn-finger nucleic acid-binding protein
MLCPVCQKDMAVLEFNQIEMDFCLSCEGCWLDAGELGLVLTGTVDVPSDWRIEAGVRSRRRCPRCGGRMSAGPLPGTTVEVDVCDRQHGMWLDQGELRAVAEVRGRAGRTTALADFLGTLLQAKTRGFPGDSARRAGCEEKKGDQQ